MIISIIREYWCLIAREGFERFIGNVGGGPGEYTMAKNFVVNEPDDEVIINASPTTHFISLWFRWDFS